MASDTVLSGTFLEFDLETEIDGLYREGPWSAGRSAKTLAKYDDLRLILTALKRGATIPTHQTDGRVSIHGIRGRLRVTVGDRVFQLSQGTILTLDRGVAHDVEAQEDSAFLLTVAWPKPATHQSPV